MNSRIGVAGKNRNKSQIHNTFYFLTYVVQTVMRWVKLDIDFCGYILIEVPWIQKSNFQSRIYLLCFVYPILCIQIRGVILSNFVREHIFNIFWDLIFTFDNSEFEGSCIRKKNTNNSLLKSAKMKFFSTLAHKQKVLVAIPPKHFGS